jgi:hypothetical protein
MSFASSLAAPANMGLKTARGLLQTPSLRSMARAVGVIMGAGMLAASYQIAYEEGRVAIQHLRAGSAHRRARNTAITLALINSSLPLELQDKLRRSHDVVRAGLAMLVNDKEKLSPEYRSIIHAALTKVSQGEPRLDC